MRGIMTSSTIASTTPSASDVERLLTVLGELHVVALERERALQRGAHARLVVDHQDLHAHSSAHDPKRLRSSRRTVARRRQATRPMRRRCCRPARYSTSLPPA